MFRLAQCNCCSWHSFAVNAAVQKLEFHRIWPGKEKDGMGADSTDWCPRWLSSAYHCKFLQNVPPSFLHSHFHIYRKTIIPVFKAVHDPFLYLSNIVCHFPLASLSHKIGSFSEPPTFALSQTSSCVWYKVVDSLSHKGKNRFHPLVLFSDGGRFHLRDTWTLRIALTYLQKLWCVVCW